MKVIVTIASGKGGTGKTTLAVNLAEYLRKEQKTERRICLFDCDVEAPNDKLFLNEKDYIENKVKVPKPVWNKDNCKNCGKCSRVCRYNAIARLPGKILIFKDLCHSCGACEYICPENAITEEDYSVGTVYRTSDNLNFDFVYGELNIGETASPTIVKAIKKYINSQAVNIIDAPPGTGCSVVSTLEDSDAAILVTEPTPFGLYDLKLAVQLTMKLDIPFGVVINRSDGHDRIIMDFLEEYGIPFLGKIPFERKYAETYSNGDMLVNTFPDFQQEIANIYNNILDLINLPGKPVSKPVEEEKITKNLEPEEYFGLNNRTITDNPLKEIMIISGKGGTGKTTISAAFAQLSANNKGINVFEDCDVDAADLHLLLKPEVIKKTDFSGSKIAEIDQQACTGCGKCVDFCRFGAIEIAEDRQVKINPLKCEGCGLCLLVCPDNAVKDRKKINGQEYVSDTDYGIMFHADLGVAEENSGKLVSSVRSKAHKLAEKADSKLIIGDGPPGVGCPVIASITGIDIAIIITEPTVSGIHDMIRALRLTKHFNIPAKIIVNKADLNEKMTQKIKLAVYSYNSEVISEIPFDRNINDALICGKTIIEYGKGQAFKEIKSAWEKILDYAENNRAFEI